MWTYIVIALLAIALSAYVWARQARHTRSPVGKPLSREDLLAQRRSYWGHGG